MQCSAPLPLQTYVIRYSLMVTGVILLCFLCGGTPYQVFENYARYTLRLRWFDCAALCENKVTLKLIRAQKPFGKDPVCADTESSKKMKSNMFWSADCHKPGATGDAMRKKCAKLGRIGCLPRRIKETHVLSHKVASHHSHHSSTPGYSDHTIRSRVLPFGVPE